jgi:hypothetical protein
MIHHSGTEPTRQKSCGRAHNNLVPMNGIRHPRATAAPLSLEERRLHRVSKDGREHDAEHHPSRRASAHRISFTVRAQPNFSRHFKLICPVKSSWEK